MSWAAIAGTLGTIAKGTVAVGKGALSLGSKGIGLGVKGGGKVLGQLNPMAGTVGSTMGPQQASMMNKFLMGAKNLGGQGLGKLNQLGIDPNSMGPNQSLLTRFTGGAKELAGQGLGKLNQLGIDPNSMGPNQPLMTRLGKAGKGKLGELVKELPQRGMDSLEEQNKRNQELVSRYSTTPSLNRPTYSTNLQSILQDYRRS